ncbi:MAG: hypothetical protein J0I20_28320 [Chloroflexi bacterium]|nr:hypothetical protein [Chloroflexota bacterium]OJV97591.1 MAG: hypothetical protein BGO39_07450 [Chloroflexi bacterium 54-19]
MENRKRTKILLAIVGIGIIILAGLGGFWWSNSTKQPSPQTRTSARVTSQDNKVVGIQATATPHEIASTLGDTLFGYGYIVTVDDTDHSDIFNDQFVASENHTMHAYHVVMESNSPGGIEVNPRYWRLFDSQNPAYPEIFAGKDPSLPTTKVLPRGEKQQGWLTFEIPKGANHFRLAYDIPNISQKASFVFDVG